MKWCCITEVAEKTDLGDGIVKMDFYWKGDKPRAGQFFLIKARPSSVFLARPLSVLDFDEQSRKLSFLVAVRGAGTQDIVEGSAAELRGPLGSGFQALKTQLPLALVAGGIGVTPLFAFARELRRTEPQKTFAFFAGFRERLPGIEKLLCENLAGIPLRITYEQACTLPQALRASVMQNALITDALDLSGYGALYACGPEPLLKALGQAARTAELPCFVSTERRMACGLGACLGCTVRTIGGNKRCCTDGPVFNAQELLYD
jgi:NAD(P)H-flavin reductase